jgi:hypothetical protein
MGVVKINQQKPNTKIKKREAGTEQRRSRYSRPGQKWSHR